MKTKIRILIEQLTVTFVFLKVIYQFFFKNCEGDIWMDTEDANHKWSMTTRMAYLRMRSTYSLKISES